MAQIGDAIMKWTEQMPPEQEAALMAQIEAEEAAYRAAEEVDERRRAAHLAETGLTPEEYAAIEAEYAEQDAFWRREGI